MNYRSYLASRETAVFPTGTNIKIAETEKNEYYEDDLTYYIMKKNVGNTFRVVSGWGAPDQGMIDQETFLLTHDQTGRFLGSYTIVGYVHQGEVEDFGMVESLPTRALPLSVLK